MRHWFPLIVLLGWALEGRSHGEPSTFDEAEPEVASSPREAQALALAPDENVVDLDVSPIRPEAALVIKAGTGKQRILFWKIGAGEAEAACRSLEIPAELSISAIAWHPLGQSLFLLATRANQQEILKTPADSWAPTSIYRSSTQLRRLVIGPRPYSIAPDPEEIQTRITSFRVFFGVKKADGKYSTHTVTENGEFEYAVLDSQPPAKMTAASALPAGFHPAGHFMLWEDEKHCFRKAEYNRDDWATSTPAVGGRALCKGSLTYTPNGAGLLQWQSGTDGVTLRMDRGEKASIVAKDVRFESTPSSVADGKGLVGVTREESGLRVRYVPIDVPLADVVNAWMFLETARDRELFSANTGLFRSLKNDQLYELYDSESYFCGYYDSSTPTRPYFVTTDIFWELYAAAFEGIFILSEKQAAIPSFWKFVEGANESLKGQPQSRVAKAFAAILAVRDGNKSNDEAARILRSEGVLPSSVTGEKFDFGNLKPRSHYVKEPDLQRYFRASRYLFDLKLTPDETEPLKKLPGPVVQDALAWIGAYLPFVAPSKRPLLWGGGRAVPSYVLHPETQEQVFPLSWGMDNEILFSTVWHPALPEAEQVKGPDGSRLLPSGLDVAAVLGSPVAEALLDEAGELRKYPPLRTQLAALRKRFEDSRSKVDDNLYQRWLSGLATQWSASVAPPGEAIDGKLWSRKRLQTGLASWATLRHSTLLVNERSDAECGEAGFEYLVMRLPRGYVEPDPATFEAISGLFDATIAVVKAQSWVGDAQGIQEGVIGRLTESRDKAGLFRDIAKKELAGEPLTPQEYDEILYVGRAAEHNFLIFKSLANKDFALSRADPMAKIADVAGTTGSLLLAGVGAPAEWDQVVPFFGRKEIVKGSSYSYYELVSGQVMNDAEWRAKLPSQPRPKWIEPYFGPARLSCPAKAP